MSQFDQVSVLKQANVYFDGKCVSHTVLFPDGGRKSVGVILPARPTFHTSTPEVIKTVSGCCRYCIEEGKWQECGPGESFSVLSNRRFDIEVRDAPYPYGCHFG